MVITFTIRGLPWGNMTCLSLPSYFLQILIYSDFINNAFPPPRQFF